MKTNDELDYNCMATASRYLENGDEMVVECGDTYDLDDQRNEMRTIRVYAYIWRHDQDISREGVVEQMATKIVGCSEVAVVAVVEVLQKWRNAAIARGWEAEAVEACFQDLEDELT